MTGTRLGAASLPLRTLFEVGTMTGLSDAQLLERFTARDGDAAEFAFAALVERHGKMVLRVCRTVLANADEAHDAFQATFLVLVRRARSIRNRDSLASWLHGVAVRVARSSRAAEVRRTMAHRRFASLPREPGLDHEPDDLQRVVHEELENLPERYRAAVVLCDLEGLSQEQAARRLDWPIGTVKSRLFRARERLRERLSRRGLAPSSLALFGQLPLLSKSLVSSTVSAAKGFAASRHASGLTRTAAETLAQGVLSMFRWKFAFKLAFLTMLLGSGVAGTVLFAQQKPPTAPVRPWDKPQIAFEIISITMSGLEWRDTLIEDLHFLDQVDNGIVWTLANGDAINRVLALDPGKLHLPKPTGFEGQTVKVDNGKEANYVAKMDVVRQDGRVGFKPTLKTLSHGKRVELLGTVQADGILVKGSLEDRQLLGFAIGSTRLVDGLTPQGKPQKYAAQIQSPDVRIDRVQGEWLIPTDGALLVSTGVRVGTKNFLGFGTASVEHLFLIKPWRIPDDVIAGVKPPASVRPKAN